MAVINHNQIWAGPGVITDSGSNIGYARHHPIEGKMINSQMVISERQQMNIPTPDSEIKRMLVQDLMENIVKEGFIEFTMQHLPHNASRTYRARIFVVPDTQVRLLRLNGYETVAK